MPIHIPFSQHGACQVALIAIKGQPKRVYHYSKTHNREESWALRDYLTAEILRFGDTQSVQNNGHDGLFASEIENLVVYAERPEFRAVTHVPRWTHDCQAASEHQFGAANVDPTTDNGNALGNWRRMDRKGS